MAKFVRIWTARNQVLKQLVEAAEEADANRVKEYKAAVRIQSWFRGIRLRVYLKYLKECTIVIQKHFRGYLGRIIHLNRLKECVQEMYNRYYNKMATRIQTRWRGYYTRKHVFDYYVYKHYMLDLEKKNKEVLTKLHQEREKEEEERLNRDERVKELLMKEEARRHHYMLSTECQDGVFKTQCNGSFEQTMKSMTFHQPGQTKTKQKSPQKNLTKDRVILPPLIHKPKVQGPFRTPEDVWKQRHKPLNPTLSVSTPYNSEEIARAELKAEEWRNRVIDEKFLPFSRTRKPYQSLIHTQSSYKKPVYGLRVEREIKKQPFRTVVPPIPIFEKLNSTY